MKVRQWLQVTVSVGLVIGGVAVGRSASASFVCPQNIENTCTPNGFNNGNNGVGPCGSGPLSGWEDCKLIYQGSYCSEKVGQDQWGCNGASAVIWGSSVNTNGAGSGNLSSGNWVTSGGSGTSAYLEVNQGQSTAVTNCNVLGQCQNLCTMAEGFTVQGVGTCYVADTTADGTSIFNQNGACSNDNGDDNGQSCLGNCTGSFGFLFEQELCFGFADP